MSLTSWWPFKLFMSRLQSVPSSVLLSVLAYDSSLLGFVASTSVRSRLCGLFSLRTVSPPWCWRYLFSKLVPSSFVTLQVFPVVDLQGLWPCSVVVMVARIFMPVDVFVNVSEICLCFNKFGCSAFLSSWSFDVICNVL